MSTPRTLILLDRLRRRFKGRQPVLNQDYKIDTLGDFIATPRKYPKNTGFSGEQLREMRRRNGCGRPPKNKVIL